MSVCVKCGGAGKFKKFNHVEDGSCFKCNGKGFTLKADQIGVSYIGANGEVLAHRVYDKSEKQATIKAAISSLGAVKVSLVKGW